MSVVCLLSPASRLLEFNTSNSAEIEISGRLLPSGFAGNAALFCETTHIALRYRPYWSAKWPVSECETTLLAGSEKAVLGLKRAVLAVEKAAQLGQFD